MGPSAYHAELAKDQEIENRDGVRVVFAGGNVFHIYAGDAEQPVVVRGANKAWKRAEWHRSDLNPDYVAPAEPKAEEPAAAPPPAPTPASPAKADVKASKKPAKPEVFMVGGVEGVLSYVPLADLQTDLADWQGRIASLQGVDEVRRLQPRVRATDGRCAPIFFTDDGDGGVHLFDGLSTIAAAMNAGIERVAVVIIPSDRAGEAQGVIANFKRAALAQSPADAEEEELIYRAHTPD